jgi:hypothetical protein
MTIERGGHKVEISFLGRGNTGGDAVIYVPDATILIAGDLRVAPTPFAIGSFIDEWIVTMKSARRDRRNYHCPRPWSRRAR